jgi:hypothetical protein
MAARVMTRAFALLASCCAALAFAAPGSYSGNVESGGGPSLWWLNLLWIGALVWYWIGRDDTP